MENNFQGILVTKSTVGLSQIYLSRSGYLKGKDWDELKDHTCPGRSA